MSYRTERDSMGEMLVESDKLWGAQTQRSLENFKIGVGYESMPDEIIQAFSYVKEAAALANAELVPSRMNEKKLSAIRGACEKIRTGELKSHFPLVVWQTGSGTQTNMNVNEVIAGYSREFSGVTLHPNDDVNMSQSSNDTFPTAMRVSALMAIREGLLPELSLMTEELSKLENRYMDTVKCGRTHLQDATPISFGQEVSGWRASLERDMGMLDRACEGLKYLALGGTAVGTGLNTPRGFDTLVAEKLSELTGYGFVTDPNKFHALTSLSELVIAHGAMKALAADMMKMANDVRWLASGPRNGLGEIFIPENEPGSSIMPGKVNPTQCESVTMVAVQVMANDTAVGLCASQGNFQLNVFLPVCIYNFLQSARLLSDSLRSFRLNCVSGIRANEKRMAENLNRSLMTVTALNAHVGYENAAKIAKLAYSENITLREATLKLQLMTADDFDRVFHPERMI